MQSYALGPIDENMLNECVANFIDITGTWNWDHFSSLPSHHIILKIIGIMPPFTSGENNCRYWGLARSGLFSVKSAYLSLLKLLSSENNSIWSLIWKWQGLQSIRCFLWLLVHNWLKTNKEYREDTCLMIVLVYGVRTSWRMAFMQSWIVWTPNVFG